MRALRAVSVEGFRAFLVLCAVAATAWHAAAQPQPVANDDSYSTPQGIPLTVAAQNGVLANDTGNQASLATTTANGTLFLNVDGSFLYFPSLGFTGTDSFTYVARQGPAQSNVATVTITVGTPTPTNTPPTAVADSYQVPQGQTLTVAASGVLANDTDPDGNALTAALASNPASGTLALQPDGSFTYTPPPAFSGTVTFTYQANDGSASSAAATVTIVVTPVLPVNVPPAAAGDSYESNEDQTLNVSAGQGVLANDADANDDDLTAVLVSDVASGALTLRSNGSFTYEPPSEFSGTVTFTYQADDGKARSNTATVTITVAPVDDPPVAAPDSYTTAEDTALTVGGNGVLDNDTDPEGGPLTAQLARNVADGSLQLASGGSFTYTPPANFNGTTTFTYRARDSNSASAAATVTITVTPVNDPPFITNAPPTTATEGVTYRYTLTASDPDGTTPTISAPTLPSWLEFTPPATISGTPADADVGTHDVTMSVSDGTAAAVTLPFKITVEDVDNAPVIETIPEQTATENTPFDFDLAAFVADSDTDAGALTFAAKSGVPPGLSLSSAGRLTGTPAITASVGTHTVQFTVADAENTVPGQFKLVVLPAGRVDLAVAVSASPNPVTLDTPAAWTIDVTNRAPQVQAQAVSLEATFTGQVPFNFDPLLTSGCTLTSSGEQTSLSCSLGALPGGASTSVTLTGRATIAGDVLGVARVAVTGSGALDEMPNNDVATASLSISEAIAGSPAQRIELPNAVAVAAGDLDADGVDDLAVATASSQGLVAFLSVADATGRRSYATPPLALGGESVVTDVTIVDVDRDGDLDIVTAAGNGAPDRVFVSSAGAFTSTALGNTAVESRAVTSGDVNGDAFVDLVFANPGMSTVLLNSGSGAAFEPGTGVGPHDARDVLLVDLFGDTLPELVVASGDGGAAVYRNTAGSFTLEATLDTGPTSAVAAGDFNGDGRTDLAFARESATPPALPSTLVWLNTSGSSGQLFKAHELGGAATTDLLVRDFSLDDRTDVLALNGNGARIYANAGAGNGSLNLLPQQLAVPGARGAAAGKLSNDDRTDIAIVGDDGVAVFVNDGAGNYGQPDSNPPVITLLGNPTVELVVNDPYTDAGATATDQEDGDLTSRIVVTNPVNTALIGTYTVTYSVVDLSGNPAAPVTRTVTVQAQPTGQSTGGGGALGFELLLLFAVALARRRAAH